MDRLVLALAVAIGAPMATAAYILVAERLLSRMAERRQPALRPWLWIAPALLFLAVFLVYPTIDTLRRSFLNGSSTLPVGLANYQFVFSDEAMLLALRNNALWVVVFTAATVGLGLVIAVLTDRVPYERFAKGVIFLPMAISFVAAGVIWKFMYDYRPPGVAQTGLLNGLLMAIIPGFEPQTWLIDHPPFNNLALITAAVWGWTGFCTVIISAALKGIPVELLEAARVDGASELQLFQRIIVPLLGPTLAVVATTMIIFALKAFDIVYVMTNGNYGTEVIASLMYKELFNVRDFGRASAIAVVLLVAIVPVMLLNLRRFRQQDELR